MKKLTKIKLVNWHVFPNQTIEIDNNTLVSGENGAGKSTFLDAIQFLLVGGKSGVKFNIAANDFAKRSLESYVRGKIGAENKDFLRPGDVITHIALEFYDEINKTFNIVGAVLDLPKNSSLKERLYLLENVSIADEIFIENNKPRDYKSMRDYLKSIGVEFDYFETQKKYRDALSKFFGIDALKYSKLLPKALAFKPVNLQNLVFEFLLDDDPVDIQSLKNNVNQLKKVEAQIKNDKEKLEKLEKIKEIGNELISSKEQVAVNKLINNLNWVEQRETHLNKANDEISSLDRKLLALIENKKAIDLKIDKNEKRILELEKAKDSNDLSKTIENIKQEKEALTRTYNFQNEKIAEIKSNLDEEEILLKEIIKKIPDQNFKAFCNYYGQNRSKLSLNELESYLQMVSSSVESFSKAYYVKKKQIEDNETELSEALNEAKKQLNSLEQNIKPYPQSVMFLVDSINEELSKRYDKNVNARPFADLIDINDESWRNAIEGYLNTQRFDIIIEPKYFDEALEIYEEKRKANNIFGVGLVNTTKLKEFSNIMPRSLAAKISTEHIHARNYANMLLGQVICCEKLDELKHEKRSITRTGMTYSNFTARQLNPNSWRIPFIGKNATETQIIIAREQVEKIEAQMNDIYLSNDETNNIVNLLNKSKASYLLNQNYLNFIDSISNTRKEIDALDRKMQTYASEKAVREIDDQLDKEKIEKRELRIQADSLIAETTSIKDKKAQIEENLIQTKIMLEKFAEEQKEFQQKHPEKLAIAQNNYLKMKQKFQHNYQKINDHIAREDVSLNSSIPKLENQVNNLMHDYVIRYSFGTEPIFENINNFLNEANVIKNQNLVQYEIQAVELRKNSETSFKEEFINKLRASIQNAQAQIQELNVALEGKTFGADQYKLVVFPSEDKEYAQYYHLIMESFDFGQENNLFSESLSKKNEDILMELFNKIASDDPQYDKLALNFLDYRNYMSYDIQITNQNGNISYYSKVSREKSGGETQVPFYIVIAASFQQLLSHNKRADSGCVILLDEAFNNMDESRIEAMMRFYNSLSIQLMISIPPQRVPNIIRYVNTSLMIVKYNDTSLIQSFRSDYENETIEL